MSQKHTKLTEMFHCTRNPEVSNTDQRKTNKPQQKNHNKTKQKKNQKAQEAVLQTGKLDLPLATCNTVPPTKTYLYCSDV